MTDESMICIYCQEPVERKPGGHDFCFTKRWDKKRNRYILADWCHHDCYLREYNRIMFKVTPAWEPVGVKETPDRNERQITIDDWLKERSGA